MEVTFSPIIKPHYITRCVVFAMEIRPSMAKYRLNAISSFSRYNSRQTHRSKQRLTNILRFRRHLTLSPSSAPIGDFTGNRRHFDAREKRETHAHFGPTFRLGTRGHRAVFQRISGVMQTEIPMPRAFMSATNRSRSAWSRNLR